MKLSPISRTELETILGIGTVDVGNEALFGDSRRLNVRGDQLFLIIGIGGSGLSMLRETKHLADQRFSPEYQTTMKFLAVDAFGSELREMERLGIPTLNLSVPGAPKRLSLENRTDFFRKFVPEDYDTRLLDREGTSADRLTAKIRLYDANGKTTNDRLFMQMILRIFRESWETLEHLPVNLVILSGLCGGMGSGTFLDLAIRAKAACPDPENVKVYGCLMMPDTIRKLVYHPDLMEMYNRNAQAALQELESYNSSAKCRYLEAPDPSDTVTLSENSLPFDYPFLLSGDYQDAVSAAAEIIMNLAAGHNGTMEIEGYLSSLAWRQRDTRIEIAGNDEGGSNDLKTAGLPEQELHSAPQDDTQNGTQSSGSAQDDTQNGTQSSSAQDDTQNGAQSSSAQDDTQNGAQSSGSVQDDTQNGTQSSTQNGTQKIFAGYCSAGYAYAAIPQEAAISYIVGRVGEKLYLPVGTEGIQPAAGAKAFCSVRKGLNKIDYERQLRFLLDLGDDRPLSRSSLWEKIRTTLSGFCRPRENLWDVTWRDIMNGEVQDYLNGFWIEETAAEAQKKMSEGLERFYEGFCFRAQKLMEEYGPRALVYLYEGSVGTEERESQEDYSEICIKTQIAEAALRLYQTADKPTVYPDLGPGPQGTLFLFRRQRVDEWKNQATAAAQTDICKKVCARLCGSSGEWNRLIAEKVEYFASCCERFAYILESLTDFYAYEGRTIGEAHYQEFTDTTRMPNRMNLGMDADTWSWIGHRAQRIAEGIHIVHVKRALIRDFIQNQEQWVSEEQLAARNRFDSVMAQCCGLGRYAANLNASGFAVADYFTEYFTGLPADVRYEAADRRAQEILGWFSGKDPSRYMKQDWSGFVQRQVLLPQSLVTRPYGDLLRDAFDRHLSERGGRLVVSPDVECIVSYQLALGISISDWRSYPFCL